ncbi:MAG TPA: chemotaxis protein CheA [Bryobacteraceae bacterium]|jgi:two-component system chemotaxis sensor kinase CheA|nr:chemotaxis protein CheA [Bryobacteraceae bacterium]
MTTLGLQLKQSIDDLLGMHSLNRATGAIESLGQLAGRFLDEPVSPVLRPLAADLVAVVESRSFAIEGAHQEEEFRSALRHLAQAIEQQREIEEDAGQFADDPELVRDFLVEAREHLSSVESGLLAIEKEPDDAEALNAVFRSFHSIKGLAAFLGAAAIQELAHETENVLDQARSGAIVFSTEIIDLILRSADDLTACLDLAASGRLSAIPRRDRGLLESLARAARSAEAAPVGAIVQPAAPAKESSGESAPPSRPRENVLRVDAAKLEHLIDMVGELVIAESVVRNNLGIAQSQEPLLARNLKQLARVVQEVQKTSMSMRMVSVGQVFRKMDRLVRDLSRKSGKLAHLVTSGDDVELDRGIVESLADPMVHMVRNAMDHGLEMPEERRLAGKPEQGTICLKASHDAGDIVIELADDGRGLDTAKILAKARRTGLLREDEQPEEEAIFRLILEPGFSTAEKVTDLSGRGVGMDVVKKQIQKLRGQIAIRSNPGQGCTLVLRLPLTLAIIDGLVVGAGSQRYIIPMFVVREMFSPGPETFVTIANRAQMVLFRDRLYPLVRLSRLQTASCNSDAGETHRDGGVLIIAEGRGQLFCIAVDHLIGKQEVVIKSLGATYRDIAAVSGGAILGDGRVGLILDVNVLESMHGVVNENVANEDASGAL